MKDNKLYKVLRIIFLTLAILSLVFTLCKKVGLCASAGSSDSDGIVYLENWYPIPYGNRLGYASDFDIDDSFRSRILAQTQFNTNNPVIITMYEEDLDEKLYFLCSQIKACYFNKESLIDAYSTAIANYEAVAGSVRYEVVYDISTDTFSSSTTSRFPTSRVSAFISENPAYPTSGLPYLVQKGVYMYNYPIAVFVGGEISNIDTYGYTGNFSYPMDIPFMYKLVDNDSSIPEFGDFPAFESLPNSITDSSNPDYNLYNWLNGQNEQNYNYTKSIFELIKGFFSWVVLPFDSEAASASLESIQVISDIRSLNNVVGTAGIFNWSDVIPASRVAFTFDFGGAVLPHQEYEINFDWYTGTVKTLILSILLTFLVVGLLVTIINNIPSMIHGHSGDSGGGSN